MKNAVNEYLCTKVDDTVEFDKEFYDDLRMEQQEQM